MAVLLGNFPYRYRSDVSDPSTMGAYLRAARRARRVSIERAAEETRIRPDFLMRMESDEFDFLAPTYVRGFLKSYARYLRADPEPLMTEFDARFGTGKVATAQMAALERHGKQRLSAPGPRISSWKIAAGITGGALVILAIIGIFTNPEPTDPTVANSTPSVSAEPSAEPSASTSGSPSPSPSESDDGVITFEDGIRLVILASKEDCWYGQLSPDGSLIDQGTLVTGDKVVLEADKRLEIRLGRPQGVELIVNGRNLGTPPGGAEPANFVLPDDIDVIS